MANKKTPADIKGNSIACIIQALLKYTSLSRIELSEFCGLSPSTVGANVAQLLEQNIVEEFSAGVSTGGRPPIAIRLNPNCGSTISFEITRSGVDVKIFDAYSTMLFEAALSSRMLTGNALRNVIVAFMDRVQSGALGVPQNIIGVGLLCQGDIPDFDLNVEYSTSIASDVVSLERFLSGHLGVPVRKEYIERYSLEHYMQNIEAAERNYAYINIGKCATASFFINKKLVEIAGESSFDISGFSAAGLVAAPAGGEGASIASAIEALNTDQLVERLAALIASARIFFPVEDIFLGGARENLDEIAYKTSQRLNFNPPVRRIELKKPHLAGALSRRLTYENYRLLFT